MSELYCKIKTPQYKDNELWSITTQRGVFNFDNLFFKTNDELFGVDVQFNSIDEFKSALIKTYKKN